jgi:hypothetical protein
MTQTTGNNISIIDFAKENGLRKQTVFKSIKRLGIEIIKSRGGRQHRGSTIALISKADESLILKDLKRAKISQISDAENPTGAAQYEIGVFYLLSLEPKFDQNRFKVGFASNLDERLRQHRCVAPFVEMVKTWPCRRLWEKTAIDSVTIGCERLHTEVFRAPVSLQTIEDSCTEFFSKMPKP